MKRRSFFKTLGTGLLIPVAPAIVHAGWIMPVRPLCKNPYDAEWFSIDTSGQIIWTGPDDKSVTVLDFYRWLSNKADQAEPSPNAPTLDITSPAPAIRRTDHYIQLHPELTLDRSAAIHLTEGSVADGPYLWSSEIELTSPAPIRTILRSPDKA